MDQTRRENNKKVLDRIASDPQFREEILDDPKGAMERAGFKWEGGEDVTGYGYGIGTPLPPVSEGSGVSALTTCVPPPDSGGSPVTAVPGGSTGGSTVGKDPGTTTSYQDPTPK